MKANPLKSLKRRLKRRTRPKGMGPTSASGFKKSLKLKGKPRGFGY